MNAKPLLSGILRYDRNGTIYAQPHSCIPRYQTADIVYRNAEIFDAFSCSWEHNDLAVKSGIIVGIGQSYRGISERDLCGAHLVPGLIDAHVHIESSLLVPYEYARLVASRGTTTVIADPHEIANVAGVAGIEYMLAARTGAPVDILYMLPSCVPADAP